MGAWCAAVKPQRPWIDNSTNIIIVFYSKFSGVRCVVCVRVYGMSVLNEKCAVSPDDSFWSILSKTKTFVTLCYNRHSALS